MIELERTYLAKFIPDGIRDEREIKDIAIPISAEHPHLRIRKIGNKIEMTKKVQVNEDDASKHHESTIYLTEEEYEPLSKIDGKPLHKIRYLYDHKGRIAEIDVYQGPLKGLVTVDFEFDSEEEMKNFKMPDFCLVEVTHLKFAAGGRLAGKSYEEIRECLESLGYKKLC